MSLALGGAAITPLAGCIDGILGTNETPTEGTNETLTEGTSETPTEEPFREWLVDPTNTHLDKAYGVFYYDVEAIRKRRDEIHENAYDQLEEEMLNEIPSNDLLNLDDVSAILGLDFEAAIAFGSFDLDAFEDRLAERRDARPSTTGPPETEEYRGFRLLSDRRVFAVSEDVVLSISPFRDGDHVELTKALIDARLDGETRYGDANEYVDAMLGIVDDAHALICFPEAMDGSIHRGFRTDAITGELKSWRFGPQTTEFILANTYPDADAVDEAEFESHLASDQFAPYDGLDVRTDGKMVWTEGTIPTGQFDYLSPGGPDDSVHPPIE